MFNRVKDTLRSLFIDDWQSDPYYQHQNFAERRQQTTNRQTNTLLGSNGAPARTWFLAMMHFFVINHTHSVTINNIHINATTITTCDILSFLLFYFLQSVYFNSDDINFLINYTEELV